MGSLVPTDPSGLLCSADEVSSPVLRVILERVAAGSRPRARTDDHVVCLAIEGGGMRGAVSAGMCLVLEATGLVPAFDRIYGVSAGALNGSATAAGQAALSATHYQDAATRRVINRMRPVLRRALVDMDFLFSDLIATRKPLSFDGLSSGPEFRALAVSLETTSLRVLSGFADIADLMDALRASASLPRLGGPPPIFRGERMTDGAVLEPIPFETALCEGATHVLVLRTRPAEYRQPGYLQLAETLALREHSQLADLRRARPGTYNRQASDLQRRISGHCGEGHVLQIAVPDGTRLIGRLETSGPRVVDALRSGAAAMAEAILMQPIDLCWQPVIYGTAGAETPVRGDDGGRRPGGRTRAPRRSSRTLGRIAQAIPS